MTIVKRVYWGITVSKGKSKTVMAESMAASRQVDRQAGRHGS